MRLVRLAIATLLAGLASGPASGWGNPGHAQVAAIAWSRLDTETRTRLVETLERHPRFEQDFAARMPKSVRRGKGRGEWIFLQAAIWPDLARRYADSDDDRLRRLNRPRWHYINYPIEMDDGRPRADPETGLGSCRAGDRLNLVQALRLARCKLASSSLEPAERALYVSWLMHLVGDAHQPLHAVSLYGPGRLERGDRGGNAIRPKGVANLHSFWDRLPGKSGRVDRVGRSTTTSAARKLLESPHLVKAGGTAAAQLDFDAWILESRELARRFVYSEDVVAQVAGAAEKHPRRRTFAVAELDARYVRQAGTVADRRIVEAGYRLAGLLELVLAVPDDPN